MLISGWQRNFLQETGKGKNLPDNRIQLAPQRIAAKNQDPLYKACQEFESMFINEIFKSMRRTIPQGTLLETGMAEDIFQGMMDEEMAKEAAKKNSFGLAAMLYHSLVNNYGD